MVARQSRAGNSIYLGARRVRPMPSEAFIYHQVCERRAIEEIAAAAGMSVKSLKLFIKAHEANWQARPPKRLIADERRTVITREVYADHAWRMASISLPRISMCRLSSPETNRYG